MVLSGLVETSAGRRVLVGSRPQDYRGEVCAWVRVSEPPARDPL